MSNKEASPVWELSSGSKLLNCTIKEVFLILKFDIIYSFDNCPAIWEAYKL